MSLRNIAYSEENLESSNAGRISPRLQMAELQLGMSGFLFVSSHRLKADSRYSKPVQ